MIKRPNHKKPFKHILIREELREPDHSRRAGFMLKPLSVAVLAALEDEESREVVVNGQTIRGGKQGKIKLDVLKYGIVAQFNFEDENGREVEFDNSSEEAILDSLSFHDPDDLNEAFAAILGKKDNLRAIRAIQKAKLDLESRQAEQDAKVEAEASKILKANSDQAEPLMRVLEGGQ